MPRKKEWKPKEPRLTNNGALRKDGQRKRKPGPIPGRPAGEHLEAAKARKRHKYNAKGEYVDGRWFDSGAEAMRYKQLKELEAAGFIINLQFHTQFPVLIKGKQMFVYKTDFTYDVIEPSSGNVIENIVEDVKGMKTPVYRLKKKIVEAEYGFPIAETPGSKSELKKWKGATPFKTRPNQRKWEMQVHIAPAGD